MRLSNSKAPSHGKRNLLTSYNVNDVTERAPRDYNGNVTLMAKGAKQGFILHFATLLMLQSCFLANNEVQTMFTPNTIPDKNTREFRNNVNPTNKKFNFSRFWTFYVLEKNLAKVGEKQSIMSVSM